MTDNFRLMRKSREPEMIPVMFLGSLSQQGARKGLNLENWRRVLPILISHPPSQSSQLLPLSPHIREQEAASGRRHVCNGSNVR